MRASKTIQRRKTTGFEFVPPSAQQLRLMSWWTAGSPYADYDGVIADGSIRSGKTVGEIDGFISWSLSEFEYEDFIIGGRSVGAVNRNVLKPMFEILRAKGIQWLHHRSDNWVQIGTNIYRVFGGSKADSHDDLAGLTAAGALVDEATRLHPDFIAECINRCSVQGSKYWFNCNPEGPYHTFKKEYIDKAAEKRLLRLHFTLDDNPALSEDVKARYRRMFDGLWYKRYILGLWVVAAGAIYDMFDEGRHVKPLPEEGRKKVSRWVIPIDYGTSNPTTFALHGYWHEGSNKSRKPHAHCFKEYYHSGREGRQKTDEQYVDDLVAFIPDRLKGKATVIVDPSAASFIAACRKRGLSVKPAENDVVDGIRFVSSMLADDRYTIDPSCTHTVREYQSYVWDEKAQERGEDKPKKEHDHTCDRDRYGLYTTLGVGRDWSKLSTIKANVN